MADCLKFPKEVAYIYIMHGASMVWLSSHNLVLSLLLLAPAQLCQMPLTLTNSQRDESLQHLMTLQNS